MMSYTKNKKHIPTLRLALCVGADMGKRNALDGQRSNSLSRTRTSRSSIIVPEHFNAVDGQQKKALCTIGGMHVDHKIYDALQ